MVMTDIRTLSRTDYATRKYNLHPDQLAPPRLPAINPSIKTTTTTPLSAKIFKTTPLLIHPATPTSTNTLSSM